MKLDIFNPFPGLRPFESNEEHLFFGRERHVSDILRKLEKFRFVSVVGNSGSGKSSLVKAGLLPTIRKTEDWLICILRPGKNPVKELAKALLEQQIIKIGDGQSRDDFIKDQCVILDKNVLGLVQTVRKFIPPKMKLLILVDQFEEIFRFGSIEHKVEENAIDSHFVDLLLASTAQKDVPIYAMLTLRSDFLGDCEQFMGLPEAINDGQFLVPRMNRDDLSLCLTGPVSVANGKISPRLVQQLLNEIGTNSDQLPILQHVMMRTWEVWIKEGHLEQPMDLNHYEQTGGMEKALSNHAEEAFSEIKTEDHRAIAKMLFKTITVKGQDNRGVRRPTQINKVAKIAGCNVEEVIEIANIFRRSDRGFIMPSEKVELNELSILDISHESLMRVWDRLGTWVEEEADSAELYERITDSAILYEQEKAGLWRDPDLQIAVDWKSRNNPNKEWSEQYNSNYASAMRFIQASEQEKKYERAERERRSKLLRISLITVLLALMSLSIWAITERNNSVRNASEALDQKSLAEAQTKIAEEQTKMAQTNFEKAKEEEKKAQQQQKETEIQKSIALQSAEEARLARLRAESESLKAKSAKDAADKDKQVAQRQKSISDSLRIISEKSEKKATKLRILALSQNIAIKSRLADKNTMDPEVKSLLALQSYKFNKDYDGKQMDAEIFNALFSSVRMYQNSDEYMHKLHKNVVKSLSYNPKNGDLASTGDDGKIIITPANGKSKVVISNPQQLLYDNIRYSPNGEKLAISADNNSLFIFNTAELSNPPQEIKNLHRNKIQGIEWYGEKIITVCLDRKVRIINVNSEKIEKEFSTWSKPLCMDFNEKKRLLAIGCDSGFIYSINNVDLDQEFKLVKELQGSQSIQVNCINIDPQGKLIAIGTGNGQCLLLNAANGTVFRNLYSHSVGVTHIRFSSNSAFVATSCRDKKVRLFNIAEEGSAPIVFSEHSDWVNDVVFSPNGNNLASAGKDNTVMLYPIDPNEMKNFLSKTLKRNLTGKEWENYIGNDVSYQKTIESI